MLLLSALDQSPLRNTAKISLADCKSNTNMFGRNCVKEVSHRFTRPNAIHTERGIRQNPSDLLVTNVFSVTFHTQMTSLTYPSYQTLLIY